MGGRVRHPLACSNLRWGIGTLPPQAGVYVPRRLSQVYGSVTSRGWRLRCRHPLLTWLVRCHFGALFHHGFALAYGGRLGPRFVPPAARPGVVALDRDGGLGSWPGGCRGQAGAKWWRCRQRFAARVPKLRQAGARSITISMTTSPERGSNPRLENDSRVQNPGPKALAGRHQTPWLYGPVLHGSVAHRE
jgi:hypothetical protein